MTKTNNSIGKRILRRLEFLADSNAENVADLETVCRSITKALLQPGDGANATTYWACIAVRCAQALALKFPGKTLLASLRGSKVLHKAWQRSETPAAFVEGFHIDAAKIGLQEAIDPHNLPERILAMAVRSGGVEMINALFDET